MRGVTILLLSVPYQVTMAATAAIVRASAARNTFVAHAPVSHASTPAPLATSTTMMTTTSSSFRHLPRQLPRLLLRQLLRQRPRQLPRQPHHASQVLVRMADATRTTTTKNAVRPVRWRS